MYFEFDVTSLPEVVSVYMVRRRTVWQIVDPNTLLIFIHEGRCRITLDNTEYRLEAGELLIIPAGHHYIRRPIDNEFCTLYYAHIKLPCGVLDDGEAIKLLGERRSMRIQSDMSGDRMPDMHKYIASVHTDLSEAGDEVLELYRRMMSLRLKSTTDSRTSEAMTAVELLLKLACAASTNLKAAAQVSPEQGNAKPLDSDALDRSSPSVNAKLRKVFAYIRLHAKESITLYDLCSVCNFSKQHLIRVFSSEFGMPPKTYILDYRINCAKELFYRDPNLSVKEVADEMGFSDQHYFSRLFTRISGITPTAYKRHLQNFDPSKQ